MLRRRQVHGQCAELFKRFFHSRLQLHTFNTKRNVIYLWSGHVPEVGIAMHFGIDGLLEGINDLHWHGHRHRQIATFGHLCGQCFCKQ